MRNTFSGLSIAKSGLYAHRTAMEVTAQNIANAGTEGYTRQRAVLASAKSYLLSGSHDATMGHTVGNGVLVTTVQQLRDVYMDAKIVDETSDLAGHDLTNTLLKQVEAIVNEPGLSNIANQLDKYWAAWQDLANDPSNTALRRGLVAETESLIDVFKEIDSQLKYLQGVKCESNHGGIETQIRENVNQVNKLASEIAALNREIARSEINGSTANELRDQRQVALEDLAELVNIKSFYNKKGELTVNVGDHVLIQHEYHNDLYAHYDPNSGKSFVSPSAKGLPDASNDPDVASAVPTGLKNLNNMTLTVTQTAEKHSMYSFLTYHPLTGPLSDFGITSGTFTVNGKTFELDAENTGMKELASMLNDANIGLEAYINESGQLILNASASGTKNSIKTEDGTSNLFTVLNLHDSKQPRDAIFNLGNKEYVLPTNSIQDLIPGVNLEIKKPGVATLGLTPAVTGGKLGALLSVRDGEVQTLINKLNEMAYAVVSETNALHRLGYGLDGETGRNFFQPMHGNFAETGYKNAIENMAVDSQILADLNVIAASGGTYENEGDRLRTYNGDGNGYNAIEIAQLKHKALFNDGKTTLNSFYNEAITQLATASKRAENEVEYGMNVISHMEKQRQSQAGVSLDEELANLIKYQHAYNASAKAISVIDEMLDKLINGMI